VLIFRAPGTNCDGETAHAFELAGGAPERWHINRVLEESARVADFQVLCIPGGFSYGDDIAAGRILGNQIQHHLADTLATFREAGKLIIGICNGFQAMVNMGLLPGFDGRYDRREVALLANDCGNFRNDWVKMQANQESPCIFTRGIEFLELPVRHGEGMAASPTTPTAHCWISPVSAILQAASSG
jgi:phosphoribosylformylglycinamidine synthase